MAELKELILIFTCFLLLAGVVSCGASPQAENQPTQSGAILTLEERVAKADLILVGKVTDITYTEEGGRGNIFTLVTVAVEETIKGKSVEMSQ